MKRVLSPEGSKLSQTECDIHSERSVCYPPSGVRCSLRAKLCLHSAIESVLVRAKRTLSLYEIFVCLYTRTSYRSIRDVPIALYERLVSSYTRYSFRSNRDAGYGRDKMFIQCWRDILSNAGEALYPRLDKPLIQGGINTLSKSDDKH